MGGKKKNKPQAQDSTNAMEKEAEMPTVESTTPTETSTSYTPEQRDQQQEHEEAYESHQYDGHQEEVKHSSNGNGHAAYNPSNYEE